MKKQILFITATRIGDAVLSTGILRHIEDSYPDAEVTIVCGPLCVSLFEGVPFCKEIIALKKQKYNRHWFDLWRKVIKTKWDIVIDVRNSAVSRLIFAKKRYIAGLSINKSAHKVEQASQLIAIDTVSSPKLWFTDEQLASAEKFIGQDKRPIMAIGPTANWIGKTWPSENFIALIDRLAIKADAPLAKFRIAILAAPGEENAAQHVYKSLPDDRRIDLIAKTSPGEAAAFLSKCEYYIGNDSGLMHCAAASGVKTLGLFGPSWPHLYRPWGEHSCYVATEQSFDQLIDFDGYSPKTLDRSLMVGLDVECVFKSFMSLT